MRVCVGACGGAHGPISRLRELTEANQGERATREHAELQRIEWTQLLRIVCRHDRRVRIAGLAVHETERVAPGSVILAMLPDTGARYLSTALFAGIETGSDSV